MDEPILKPCPVCSCQEVEIVVENRALSKRTILATQGRCIECGLTTRWISNAYKTVEERVAAAIVLWNRRGNEKPASKAEATTYLRRALNELCDCVRGDAEHLTMAQWVEIKDYWNSALQVIFQVLVEPETD